MCIRDSDTSEQDSSSLLEAKRKFMDSAMVSLADGNCVSVSVIFCFLLAGDISAFSSISSHRHPKLILTLYKTRGSRNFVLYLGFRKVAIAHASSFCRV